MRFEIYRDAHGEGRWRLLARNGRIVAASGEGFSRLRDVERSVRKIQRVTGALASARIDTVDDIVDVPARQLSAKSVATGSTALQGLIEAVGGEVR